MGNPIILGGIIVVRMVVEALSGRLQMVEISFPPSLFSSTGHLSVEIWSPKLLP